MMRQFGIVIAVMVATEVALAGTSESAQFSSREIAIYSEIFRSVIDQRLGYTPDAVFFLSLSQERSVQPERRKLPIRDAPAQILDRLRSDGLPVFPGSEARQDEPKHQVTHRSTARSGLKVILNQVEWEKDSEAIVYCETYAHGKDASGRIYRVAPRGEAWTIVSVVYKWKS